MKYLDFVEMASIAITEESMNAVSAHRYTKFPNIYGWSNKSHLYFKIVSPHHTLLVLINNKSKNITMIKVELFTLQIVNK